MGTWLVTGAGGFIGSHLCERLLREGERVVGLDHLCDAGGLTRERLARLHAHEDFHLEVGDVAAPGVADGVVAAHRPRTAVHLAARTGVRGSARQPCAYAGTNVVGTVALLEACRHHGVGHVVYASSSSVYGDGPALPSTEAHPAEQPLSLYAATKRAAELVAHSYGQLHGLPTTGLRFFTVYGPRGRPDMAYFRFAQAITTGRPVTVYGDGSARRDLTYVDDVVDGVLAVAPLPPAAVGGGAPSQVFNLGFGRSETVSRLIGLLEELLERPALRRYLPAAAGDATATEADPRRLAAATGFRPRVPLDEGLARFVEWFVASRAGARRSTAARSLTLT